MNPIKKFKKNLRNMFFKKKDGHIIINKNIAIIQPTDSALENNTIDKFNKIIKIISGVQVVGKEIRWGRVVNEYPYSEETITAIKQVHEIPIVERKFDSQINFFQEPDFGSVENLI